MEPRDTIILCQPDSLKSCCACCGLFNYRDISKGTLEWRLANSPYSIAENENIDTKPQKYHHDIRDITSHICKYQGFINGNRPGCTLHPKVRTTDERERSLYGSRICQEYLCPAHTIFSTFQKELLISSLKGWYEYCIAIIDPESFIWIVNEIKTRFAGYWTNELFSYICSIILKCLLLHGEYLSKVEIPIFYYSLAEYKQNRSLFTIESNLIEQSEIRRIVNGLL